MTIKQLLATAAPRLEPPRIVCAADRNVGRFEAELLLAHVLKRDRVWLLAHGDEDVSAPAMRKFRALAARRARREPIAYIIGTKDFYGRPFAVNRHVLIPRPETELLVDLATRVIKPDERAVVWDAGTGSGAVGVSLALERPRVSVIATDISTKAIKVAGANANRQGVADRMHFLKADLLDQNVLRLIKRQAKTRPPAPPTAGLVIVANLPYLPDADRKRLHADVVKYEPKDALFAGKDGLAINRRLLEQIAASGQKPRAIFIEFDPPQAVKLKTLAQRLFPRATVRIHRDLARRNRVLEIRAPTGQP